MKLQDYLDLITSQHKTRPKFIATLEALLKPVQGVADLLDDMRTIFDLDTAIGQQLDATGIRIGRTRYLKTPLEGIYFSWNEKGVGWQEGIWKGLYDPDTGLIRLPDDIYRTLLKAKVAANQWDGTIPGAYEVWDTVFPIPDLPL